MSELNTDTNEAAVSAEAASKKSRLGAQKARFGAQRPRVPASGMKATRKAAAQKKAPKSAPRATPGPKTARPGKTAKKKGVRGGSKTETILGLVNRAGGASLNEIIDATGWQVHSVRGFISAVLGGKMKLTIVSSKNTDGERSYSIRA